jgi:hypothetical protein
MTVDLSRIYAPDRQAKIAKLDAYIRKVRRKLKPGSVVTLTGNAPVWLYLAVAHALHGGAKILYYESPVTGLVEVFNHDPHARKVRNDRRERKRKRNTEERPVRTRQRAL